MRQVPLGKSGRQRMVSTALARPLPARRGEASVVFIVQHAFTTPAQIPLAVDEEIRASLVVASEAVTSPVIVHSVDLNEFDAPPYPDGKTRCKYTDKEKDSLGSRQKPDPKFAPRALVGAPALGQYPLMPNAPFPHAATLPHSVPPGGPHALTPGVETTGVHDVLPPPAPSTLGRVTTLSLALVEAATMPVGAEALLGTKNFAASTHVGAGDGVAEEHREVFRKHVTWIDPSPQDTLVHPELACMLPPPPTSSVGDAHGGVEKGAMKLKRAHHGHQGGGLSAGGGGSGVTRAPRAPREPYRQPRVVKRKRTKKRKRGPTAPEMSATAHSGSPV
eukprot:CAMPEP_0198679438 /NCGR_PEP_ID=MMETSP1468-20131203/2748_1 /TAXON_ID=1461545 /ORGANISM="Mantoniella sp, Strain CCMP1436" /LENGTH=332 /DNA_ID=CAMNT_0044418159 /DNA_START=49 /DNA_END=1047 /DNA_ORIENTATION=-